MFKRLDKKFYLKKYIKISDIVDKISYILNKFPDIIMKISYLFHIKDNLFTIKNIQFIVLDI